MEKDVVFLSKDEFGNDRYDYGVEGRDFINVDLYYENGKLVDVKFSDLYLIVRKGVKEIYLTISYKSIYLLLDNNITKKELKLVNVKPIIMKLRLKVIDLSKFEEEMNENKQLTINLFVKE